MDAPWVIDQEFLEKHKIDYVTHDELPYADTSGGANDVYDFVRPTTFQGLRPDLVSAICRTWRLQQGIQCGVACSVGFSMLKSIQCSYDALSLLLL